MNYTYRMRTDTIFDEEHNAYTVYGIEAFDLSNRKLESIPDVLFEKQKMETFVACCNTEKISLLHLLEKIEELIG